MTAQSGLQVEMKCGLGTAESVFTTRLMQTFQVRLRKNLKTVCQEARKRFPTFLFLHDEDLRCVL